MFPGQLPWYTFFMDPSLKIDVASLDLAQRQAMEDVLGVPLRVDQRLIIQVATLGAVEPQSQPANVMDLVRHFYDGVSENEVEEIDALIKARAT